MMIHTITYTKYVSTIFTRHFDNTHQAHRHTQQHNLLIPPKLLPPHRPSPPSERRRLMRHIVCLIHQQLDSLAATQNLLHVLHHDVLDLCKLALGTIYLVCGWRGVVCVHETSNGGAKSALESVGRDVGERGR